MKPQTERRIFRRIDGEIPVQYSLPGANREYKAITKNVSGGGICMPVSKKISPGTIIDLEIFRDSQNITSKCKAEVRWVSGVLSGGKRTRMMEAGIKFLDASFLFIGNLIGDLETQKINAQLQEGISQ